MTMKERAYIYAGETVILRFEARKEGQILDLSGYDVEIDIATTAMGTHLVKQSLKGAVDISQAERGMLLCSLSAEDTGSLTPGTATIGVRLMHDTFVRMGFDASIEVLRPGATPGAVLSRTAQPVITLHTPCIWVYMDFAPTRGDDGETPYIGENGNWFIGDEDTGQRALGVTYEDLTPEQIGELQRPATEAAIGANKAAQAAISATKEAMTATEGAATAAAAANAATTAATTATTAANNAATEATAAAGDATAAATEATNAANAANTAAEGINGKIAGKADLDPATGYVESSQLAPLQGRQTGVQMGTGRFQSSDASLLIDGDKSFAVVFRTGDDIQTQQFLYNDHAGSVVGPSLYIAILQGKVRCQFCSQYLVNADIKPNTLYSVVVSVTKGGASYGYINGVSAASSWDQSRYTSPDVFVAGDVTSSRLPFFGQLLSMRLFDYALSASEAAALWNGGQPERYMLPLSGAMREGLVAEYIPAGLLTDRWRDTSGNKLDLPYVPTATGGTAALDYRQPPLTPSGSPLHDLFTAAGAVWNDATKSWTVADYAGIDTPTMTDIYTVSHNQLNRTNWNGVLLGTKIPVNLPPRYSIGGYNGGGTDAVGAFAASKFEQICVTPADNTPDNFIDCRNMFRNNTRLRKISGIIQLVGSPNVPNMFYDDPVLERVRIAGLKQNIDFRHSALLWLETLQYLVENAANTAAITVTVHADVYAKLTDPANTEWYAVNTAAQTKQISFATA